MVGMHLFYLIQCQKLSYTCSIFHMSFLLSPQAFTCFVSDFNTFNAATYPMFYFLLFIFEFFINSHLFPFIYVRLHGWQWI